ncbi:unnamed protein product [Pichia kudriavzevii]
MFATRNITIGVRTLRPTSFLKTRSFLQQRLQSTLKKSYEPTKSELDIASKMSWEQFLTMRKQQRRLGGIGSIAAAILAMGASFSYFSQIEIDPTETLFGLDIFTVYIGAILCTGFVGFMLGPAVIGDPLFAIINRKNMATFRNKAKVVSKAHCQDEGRCFKTEHEQPSSRLLRRENRFSERLQTMVKRLQ